MPTVTKKPARRTSPAAESPDTAAVPPELVALAGDGGAVRTAEGFVVFQVKMPIAAVQPAAARRTGIAKIKVSRDAAASYDVAPKLANAIKALGNNTVADLLGVSRSQPGRWARGQEGISRDNEAAILDLDFVLSLLLRTMSADLAGLWLVSPNAHLGGARPVDAFHLDGHRRLVDALQAYAEGAYA